MATTLRNTTTRRRADGTVAAVRPHQVSVPDTTPAKPIVLPSTKMPLVGSPGIDPFTGRPHSSSAPEVWTAHAGQWRARAATAAAGGGFQDQVNASLFRHRANICDNQGKADFEVLVNPHGAIANAVKLDTPAGPRWAVYAKKDRARQGKPKFINPYDGPHSDKGWKVGSEEADAWVDADIDHATQRATIRKYRV